MVTSGTVQRTFFAIVIIVGETASGGIVKRSDDQTADAVVVQRLVSDMETMKASIAALKNAVERLDTNVAFLADFPDTWVEGYHNGMTVKFNRVRENTGNAYDPVTGLFTAPVSGLYAFGIKIQTEHQKPEGLNLIHEGQRFGHIYGDDPNSYDMASTLELLHVNKGERVWVTTNYDNHFRGSTVTHFLGFLLHAD